MICGACFLFGAVIHTHLRAFRARKTGASLPAMVEDQQCFSTTIPPSSLITFFPSFHFFHLMSSFHKYLLRPTICKEIQPVHSEGDQPWDFFGRNDAKAETPVLWPPHVKSWFIGKDSDAERDWGQEQEGNDRGWDGWMASLTWWTWVWVNSGRWWWTGRPGVLRFMGLQRVGHDWVTEPNWTEKLSYTNKSWSHQTWLTRNAKKALQGEMERCN